MAWPLLDILFFGASGVESELRQKRTFVARLLNPVKYSHGPQVWLHLCERKQKEAFQLGKDIIEPNDKDNKCFCKKTQKNSLFGAPPGLL